MTNLLTIPGLPMAADGRLTLVTLGATRLDSTSVLPGQVGATVLPQGKALALLTYLHCALRRTATREHLTDLLWQHSTADAARQSLRQTVYRLRSSLGTQAIVSEGGTVRLGIDLECDRDQFLAAIRDGSFGDAVDGYGGDFFPGFAAPGAVGFEQWVDLERERLRVAFICAAEVAIGLALGRGDHREALRQATRARELCPASQIAWRLRMSVFMAGNDRIHALIEAEALEAWLRREELVSDLETRQLIQRIRATPLEIPADPMERPRPDLVGREAVFAALIDSWKHTASGRGRTTFLRGTAGIGKTRLLREFHQRLTDLGVRTLMVRARPADRHLPFALAATLAESLAQLPGAMGVSPATAAILVELAPSLSSVYRGISTQPRDPEDIPRARTLALAELLRSLAEDAPLAVLVDDLHWADAPSFQLLGSLSERLTDVPVLFVMAQRPMPTEWSLPSTTRACELQPLSPDQLEAMVASMATCEPVLCTNLGQLLSTASAGVPLVALASLELALDQGLLEIREAQWICHDLEGLHRVMAAGRVLEQLLSQLPPGGAGLLTALSLAGQPLTGEVLAATIDGPEGWHLIGILEQRGLLSRCGDAWEIGHDNIAEAVLTVSNPETQTDVAGRAGRAVFERAADSTRNLQLAGRLLVKANPLDAAGCFRRWLQVLQAAPVLA